MDLTENNAHPENIFIIDDWNQKDYTFYIKVGHKSWPLWWKDLELMLWVPMTKTKDAYE